MCEAILASWLHPTFKHLLVTLHKGSFSLCDSGDGGAIFWYPSFARLSFKRFGHRFSLLGARVRDCPGQGLGTAWGKG